jgi:glutathione S-transferase
MIELYHFWDSFCSFKVRLCLEEKSLAWSGHHVDLMKFENLAPAYLAVNPKGLVPTLTLEGATIPESSIINEFLDDRFPEPPLRPADPFARARMRHWVRHEEDELFIAIRPASLNLMMKQVLGKFGEAELDRLLAHHPRPHQIAFLKKTFKEPPDPAAVDKSRKALAAAFAKMEQGLAAGGQWLAGETYSLADIAAAPVVDRVERLGMAELWSKLPAVRDWVARLIARPAYRRAAPKDEFRMPAAIRL